jgi:2-oxoglutarate dehydrogenase E2 component (dihydrolipoamide succinyltransferase)
MSTLYLKVPALGESVTEAMIGAWKRAEGEPVTADEPLVEVESDKATVEVPSPGTGVLRRILHQPGDTVPVGEVIAEIDAGARVEAPPPAPAPPAEAPATLAPAVPRAEPQGLAPAGAAAPVNGTAAVRGDGAAVKASPALRRLMAERDIAPAEVEPSGPAGRIERVDVERAIQTRQVVPDRPRAAPVSQAPAPVAPPPPGVPAPAIIPTTRAPGAAPVVEGRAVFDRLGRRERIVPMTPLRRTVARRLLEAQSNAAILTTFNEINMAEVIGLRERYQETFLKRHGIKLGFMSFFVRAAVDALKAFPLVNAEVRGTDIVYKDYYDIGVAVGGGRGLVVPVIRSADRLSLAEIERAIAELAAKARENRITLQELEGGSFTISNGGIYGSMLSTPILNPPQSGILGLHVIQKRPVAVGETIALRPMMYVALSYDHRIVDGREAVQFLVRIKECIEDPQRILIEV